MYRSCFVTKIEEEMVTRAGDVGYPLAEDTSGLTAVGRILSRWKACVARDPQQYHDLKFTSSNCARGSSHIYGCCTHK